MLKSFVLYLKKRNKEMNKMTWKSHSRKMREIISLLFFMCFAWWAQHIYWEVWMIHTWFFSLSLWYFVCQWTWKEGSYCSTCQFRKLTQTPRYYEQHQEIVLILLPSWAIKWSCVTSKTLTDESSNGRWGEKLTKC